MPGSSATSPSIEKTPSTTMSLPASGFAMTTIVCDDGNGSVNEGARQATINLEPNEDVTCTFTSTEVRNHTSEMIAEFLGLRLDFLLTYEPGMQHRIDRLNGRFGGNNVAAGFNGSNPNAPLGILVNPVNGMKASMATSLSQLPHWVR